MSQSCRVLTVVALVGLTTVGAAPVNKFRPVTQAMLLKPSPDDWLMFSRTYDGQRFSPLRQINRGNVASLKTVWTRPLGPGVNEAIPIVHDGVMYLTSPPASVLALDARRGELLWEYKHATKLVAKTKSLAIYEDLVFFTAPDGVIVALDAVNGKVRWSTQTDGELTSAPLVVNGKVLTGRAWCQSRCYISAHDARTGREAWRFYTAAGDDDPGGKTWGSVPEAERFASPWGLPGTFDPVRKLLYWGVANPTPNTRMERHKGNIDDIPRSAPADLYSNSTLALNPDTGKLAWYYQHLPGDDWDEDYTHERTLLRTAIRPNPKFVKWFNPDIPPGEERDVAVAVGEGGGIFVLDRGTGQFLWASPFPHDTPNFLISHIDGKTGQTFINWDLVLKGPGHRRTICYFNARSYYPLAYHPGLNSL